MNNVQTCYLSNTLLETFIFDVNPKVKKTLIDDEFGVLLDSFLFMDACGNKKG